MKKGFWKSVAVCLITVVSALIMVACALTPSTPEKAKERMEKQGYEVTVVEMNVPSQYMGYADQGAKKVLVCVEKDDPENVLVAIFFDDESRAERFHSKNDLKGDHAVYRQDGHWVFYGTSEAEYDFTF
jgi:hypothetical protein